MAYSKEIDSEVEPVAIAKDNWCIDRYRGRPKNDYDTSSIPRTESK